MAERICAVWQMDTDYRRHCFACAFFYVQEVFCTRKHECADASKEEEEITSNFFVLFLIYYFDICSRPLAFFVSRIFIVVGVYDLVRRK